MEQFKRAKVVMLPTNIRSVIAISDTLGLLPYNITQYVKIKEHIVPQHLYIISDDEIKERDKVIFNNNIYTVLKTGIHYYGDFDLQVSNNMFIPSNKSKKIIATTDKSLSIKLHIGEVVDNSYPQAFHNILPQPSPQFIQKYIESYNKGEIITDILVELLSEESYGCDLAYYGLTEPELKINPKDNTITIKKIKDTYSREEIFAVIETYNNAKGDAPNIVDWLKENL